MTRYQLDYLWALFFAAVGSALIGVYFGAAIALANCAQAGEMKMRILSMSVKCEWVRTAL